MSSEFADVKKVFWDTLNRRGPDQIPCPCCLRKAKINTHHISWDLAAFMTVLMSMGGAVEFVHSKEVMNSLAKRFGDSKYISTSFSILKHWGLIVAAEKNEDDTTRKTSGMWMLTAKGVSFVKGEIDVPQACSVYNNKPYSFGTERVFIKDAVKTKFNFKEFMERCAPPPFVNTAAA